MAIPLTMGRGAGKIQCFVKFKTSIEYFLEPYTTLFYDPLQAHNSVHFELTLRHVALYNNYF